MQGVGFEPTHANIADLKSAPLDLSGNLARKYTNTCMYFIARINLKINHQCNDIIMNDMYNI